MSYRRERAFSTKGKLVEVTFSGSEQWILRSVMLGKIKVKRWVRTKSKGELDGFRDHETRYIKALNREERFQASLQRSLGLLEKGFAGPIPEPVEIPVEEPVAQRKRHDSSSSSESDPDW